MTESDHRPSPAADYDAVIVGASIAGATAARALGLNGARVALVEQRPDPNAFKRVCTHLIHASAVPTVERLGLMEPFMAAGAQRTQLRTWSKWGWIAPTVGDDLRALNLRREKLDPIIRSVAAETPGVELLLGRAATRLLRDDAGAITGVVVRDRSGQELSLRAPLTVGADGRNSLIARLAGVKARVTKHGRIGYAAYFEGPDPDFGRDTAVWFLDPQWGGAFPTDSGLIGYAAMPTKARLPDFRRDPDRALVSFIADLPDAPPIRESRRVGATIGKLDMPNVQHEPTAPGLALVGDAALAADPLWGVGCGWALQSGEWLGQSVAPALAGAEPLDAALARYRRRWRRGLRGHALVMEGYATGRKQNPGERFVFSAAARDAELSRTMYQFASRRIGPGEFFARSLPRAAVVNARHALARRPAIPEPSSATARASGSATSPAAAGGDVAREPVEAGRS
jgi:flavin-dependent dehydrogenase